MPPQISILPNDFPQKVLKEGKEDRDAMGSS